MKAKHLVIGGLAYCLLMILILGEAAFLAILLLPLLFGFLIITGKSGSPMATGVIIPAGGGNDFFSCS